MKRLRRALLIFLLIFGFCSKPDDQAIRDTISEMKQEAEALNWESLRNHISKHYKDDNGNNYFIVCQILKNYIEGVENLEAQVEIMGISIRGEEAEAQIKLIARAKKGGQIYYIVGREDIPEYPRIFFKKEGRNWRIVKVKGVRASEESPW